MFRILSTDSDSVVAGTLSDMAGLMDGANIPENNRELWGRDLGNIGQGYGIDFGGLKSAEEGARIFTADGWQAGADRARAELPFLPLADLAPEAVAMKRRRTFADAGDSLRIDAAMAGNWDRAWETRARRTSRQPVTLSIGCAFGGNSEIDHNAMFWNGLQMAALCDLLENAGWRIELRALKANDVNGKQVHAQDWTVKQADQPLRMDTTLALFGHAGVYRTFGWAGNKASAFRAPSTGGSVQTGATMRKTFDRLTRAGLIPPLSLIVPPAYTYNALLANIRAAMDAIRQGAAA